MCNVLLSLKWLRSLFPAEHTILGWFSSTLLPSSTVNILERRVFRCCSPVVCNGLLSLKWLRSPFPAEGTILVRSSSTILPSRTVIIWEWRVFRCDLQIVCKGLLSLRWFRSLFPVEHTILGGGGWSSSALSPLFYCKYLRMAILNSWQCPFFFIAKNITT